MKKINLLFLSLILAFTVNAQVKPVAKYVKEVKKYADVQNVTVTAFELRMCELINTPCGDQCATPNVYQNGAEISDFIIQVWAMDTACNCWLQVFDYSPTSTVFFSTAVDVNTGDVQVTLTVPTGYHITKYRIVIIG